METVPLIYLDTHVVLWTYFGEITKLSKAACTALEKSDLRISPAVFMEMQVLFEIGRTAVEPTEILATMQRDFDLTVCKAPFMDIAREFQSETWTRDPFDRMIVAHCKVSNSSLLTKDRKIRDHFAAAIW